MTFNFQGPTGETGTSGGKGSRGPPGSQGFPGQRGPIGTPVSCVRTKYDSVTCRCIVVLEVNSLAMHCLRESGTLKGPTQTTL